MEKKSLKLGIGIVFLAIFVSFLIFQHNNKPVNIKESKAALTDTGKINAPTSFSLEKAKQKLSANVESLDVKEEDNLTSKVANELAQQIISLNANNDLSSGQLEVPNEELFSDEMIKKCTNYFLENVPVTTLAELKFISQEEPPFTSLKYFVEAMKVLADHKITDDVFQERLQSFLDNEDPTFLVDMINDLSLAIDDLKKLPIPSSYANLHLDLINFLNTKQAILKALYNYQKDPISGLVASQLLEDLDNAYQQWMVAMMKKMEGDGSINYFKF
ncbi:MAG: hypothetical protein ACP5IX_00310 [Patescibacteria group bacterium]